MRDRRCARAALAALFAVAAAPAIAGERYGIGSAATAEEVAGWDIDVAPDGGGLPPGHGNVREGEAIFAETCAGCHGARGEGKPMDQLVGGFGTIFDVKPQKTVGSFWPYATTLFDYVRRAMPLDAPQSLTPNQVYAVCAYILNLNRLFPEDSVLDAASLPEIKMPNRANFVSAYPPPTEKPAP